MLLKELEILNCRKIKQASLSFHGPGLKVVQGMNGCGKSTIAQAVQLTLEGPKAFTPGMIALGESQAEIVAVTDDGVKIRTQITGKKVSQTVSKFNADANRYINVSGGVREFLEGIRSGFELPWSMRDMTDAKIIEILKGRCGITEKINEIDALLKDKEALRTEAGRDKKRIGEPVELPEAKHPEPIDGIKAEREKAVEYIKSTANEFARVSGMIQSQCNFRSVSDMRDLAEAIEGHAQRIETVLAKNKAYTQTDVDAFDSKLAVWYEAEKKAAAYDGYLKNMQEWNRLTEQYNALTDEIEKLRSERKATLADMKLGVKGLEISEENTLVHNGAVRGITETNKVGNWSTAESVQVFFSIAACFSGDIKVIVVDNAESLDEKTTDAISKWAEKSKFLVILLKVAAVPESLEDGVIYLKEGEVVK